MFRLGNRFPCPKCKSPTGLRHCESFRCRWFICHKCAPNKHFIVFDIKYNYFMLEE